MIDSDHFCELMAEERIEPRGEIRDDLRSGIIASTIRNSNRTKKSDPIAEPLDFMPKFGVRHEVKKAFDPNALANQFREMAAKHKVK